MAFAETFKALSDPARREILELLKKGPLSAGEIGEHFDMTGATISYHLKVLKAADLVFERREKNFIYYQLNTTVLEEIMLWFSTLKGGESDD
ncbi:MAG: winged helix-turn-helix transcriptional regulator [Firmicutes bacterium]|nr:winged helix-turn-helix transcriptional regulator [Bacillota bacterium]